MNYPLLKSDIYDELLICALDVDHTYQSNATDEIKAKWFDAIFKKINEGYIEEEELREARRNIIKQKYKKISNA